MTGTEHRRNPLLALGPLSVLHRERPDPPAACEAQRGVDRFGIRGIEGRAAVIPIHSGLAQLLGQPPLAVAATAQRARLGQRIRSVVDIAELGKAAGQRVDIGLALAVPAALAELALEVCAKLYPRRRISSD